MIMRRDSGRRCRRDADMIITFCQNNTTYIQKEHSSDAIILCTYIHT